MRHVALAMMAALALVFPLAGQEQRSPLPVREFDAVSIKPYVDGAPRTVRMTPDGNVNASGITLAPFISDAYPVDSNRYLNLPEWVQREFYSVVARAPAGMTRAAVADMWKTALRDRMKLEAHYEQRDEPVYNLVLASADGRLGPRLKQGLSAPFPRRPHRPQSHRPGGLLLCRTDHAAGDTAGATAADDPPPFITALREQLGLKLEPDKAPMDVVVIDHIERPTEN